jgi:hypothetical protein
MTCFSVCGMRNDRKRSESAWRKAEKEMIDKALTENRVLRFENMHFG